MEQTQIEQIQTTNNQNNHKRLLILVAILVVVIIVAGGIFLFKDSIFTSEKEEFKQEYPVKNEKSKAEINDAERKANLNEIKIALETYYDDHNEKYPISNELTKLNDKNSPVREELLNHADKTLLEDPKDPEFYYGYKSDGNYYELTARLENLEDDECELLNSDLCIYKIVEGNTDSKESPSDAYMKYYNALMEGNMKEMKKYLAKSMIEQMEQSGMEDAKILEMLQSIAPKEVKITNEEIENNNAVLIATGGFGSQEGTIKMVRENEEWKLLYESWDLTEGYSMPLKEPMLSGKTDIAVVDILFNQTGKDKADLKVIIKNNGKVNIPKITYRFSINESEEEGSNFPANPHTLKPLGIGEELELDFSHAYSNYYNHYYKYKTDKEKQKPFKLKMVLTLDPKNELEEFDEGNNQITKIFYMQEM